MLAKRLNARQRATLEAVFRRPTLATIAFADVESLLIALGATVTERAGSRVRITIGDEQWHCHRPHPGKEARRYQVEEARELLERLGINP